MPRSNTRHPNFPIPSGPELRARGWRQEGLLRLLENVLAVGEDPENLVVYAALGRAARNWPAHEAIVRTLKEMDADQTLVIQSGKPVGLLKTHAKAPLVVMANCNIVGQWANAEYFYDLQRKGLICWGGLTAGCWQYIGSQGVIQGTYEIFMRIAEKRFGGTLAGRFVLTAGMGGWAAPSLSPGGWPVRPRWWSMSTPNASRCGARSVISKPSRQTLTLRLRRCSQRKPKAELCRSGL